MLSRRIQGILNHHDISVQKVILSYQTTCRLCIPRFWFSTVLLNESKHAEIPRKLKKSERKPLVVPINVLKRKARLEKKVKQQVREVIPHPPENGLLVKKLIPVAHEVYSARTVLFTCVSKVMENIPVYSCRLCNEVHIGSLPNKIKTCIVTGNPSRREHSWQKGSVEDVLPMVESYHLYDRLGRAVSHEERLEVDRIPAIVELCMQAGVDIMEYPTRRRTFPVYMVAGRMIDFEKRFPKCNLIGDDINEFGFWEKREKPRKKNEGPLVFSCEDFQGYAVEGMTAWERLRIGAMKLMEKYGAQTCGYCPEVQVGPKGHRVRDCQAFKHQMRDGQHAWQEAKFEDLVPPVYVWHVGNPNSNVPMVNDLKRYYGKLPAVVELFAQAGAKVGEGYSGLMRDDVVVPTMEEEHLVV
ncbi:hypothetical protein ACHQM5_000679 [Ranunculus cassubicifolius]